MEINSLVSHTRFNLLVADRTVVSFHWNDFSEEHRDGYSRLYLIKEGEGICAIEGKKIRFGQDDLVLMPAGSLLKLFPSPGLDHSWIHFDAVTEEGLPLFDLAEPGYYRKKAADEEKLYFTQLEKQEIKNNMIDKAIGESLLKLLILPFLRDAGLTIPATESQGESDKWLFQVLSALNTRLDEELTIGELARQIGCHPTYLSNAFSRKFGISPRSYLVKRRIQRSQQLLWHGRAPVKEVARMCGFKDIYYFHRCFKRLTGDTPGQYRKRRDA